MLNETTLSPSAQAVLTAAAADPSHAAILPTTLPVAAQRAVARSMLKAGLIEEVPVEDATSAWRTTEAGQQLTLRATQSGLAAIGLASIDQAASAPAPGAAVVAEPDSVTAGADEVGGSPATLPAPTHGTSGRLRVAAARVVAAWEVEGRDALPEAIAALRVTLVGHPRTQRRTEPRAHGPRSDTKHAAVLALLRRPEGASGPQMVDATGWAPHTVRGFLAGLAKRGMTVEVLERVRQVQGGKGSARGSYTIYRIAGEG